jgi:hypothetical protein
LFSEPTETSIQQLREKNMKSLTRLSAAIALTFALALTAFADCVPPVPGQIDTPPCSVAQKTPDDPTPPGEILTPPASNAENEFTISEATMNVLLSALSLF